MKLTIERAIAWLLKCFVSQSDRKMQCWNGAHMAPPCSSSIDHRFSSLASLFFSLPSSFDSVFFVIYVPKYIHTGKEGKKRKILLHVVAVAAGMLVLCCWAIPIGLHKQRPVSVKQDKSQWAPPPPLRAVCTRLVRVEQETSDVGVWWGTSLLLLLLPSHCRRERGYKPLPPGNGKWLRLLFLALRGLSVQASKLAAPSKNKQTNAWGNRSDTHVLYCTCTQTRLLSESLIPTKKRKRFVQQRCE